MKVIKTEREPDRSITHTVWIRNGESKEVRYSSIKGGLSWPTPTLPAYFCIIGERFIDGIDHSDKSKARGQLTLLAEYEATSLSLNTLFDRLINDCLLYGCDSVYSLLEDAHEEFKQAFWDHTEKRDVWKVELEAAPYADNFLVGMSLLQEWSKRFDFPADSIALKQLKSLSKEALTETPEAKFNSVNALRYVVAAFEQYPENHYVYGAFLDSNPSGSEGWMGM